MYAFHIHATTSNNIRRTNVHLLSVVAACTRPTLCHDHRVELLRHHSGVEQSMLAAAGAVVASMRACLQQLELRRR